MKQIGLIRKIKNKKEKILEKKWMKKIRGS